MIKNPRRFTACLLSFFALVSTAHAVDTTPPTLDIQQTWIEKVGTTYHFKMLLDPADNVGIDKIEFRSALNSTSALPASTPWSQYAWNPSQYGRVFDIGFVCTAAAIEVRAKDAAGNVSPGQLRTFKSPFPISTAPNLDPKFAPSPLYFATTGTPKMDCKGLFVADFDGNGYDDELQVDNSNGQVTVRSQKFGIGASAFTTTVVATLDAGSIQDAAIGDFDGDGLPDLIVVTHNDVQVFHNNSSYISNTIAFVPVDLDRSNSGITTVEHVATADMDGDGAVDAVIVGKGDNGSGTQVVKVEVLVNSNQELSAAVNTTVSPPYNSSGNGSAGRIAIGDLNNDGILDVAMVDVTGSRVVIFKGLGDGSLGGTDASDAAQRPLAIHTYGGAYKAEAIAIGDIAGRGKNDIVVTQHYYGEVPLPPYNDGQMHRAQFWQYLANDESSGFVAYLPEYLAVGPAEAANTPFSSDVMIRDYTGDRFPEIVMTSEFTDGVRLVRMTVPLNNQNQLFAGYNPPVVTSVAATQHPQRLAAGRYQAGGKKDLIIGSGGVNEVSWLFNNYTASSKPSDLVGGAATSNDPNGSLDVNGALKYTAFTNDSVNYSLTYVNNTALPITGAKINCILPPTLQFFYGGTDCVVVASGTSKSLTWTLDIPANSAGVKTIYAGVNTTVAGTVIAPAATLKKGTTLLASCTLPKVTVGEPIGLTIKPSSTSDPIGETTHKDEVITYTMRLTNSSLNTLGSVNIGTAFPAGTKYVAGSVGGVVTTGSSVLTPKIRGTAGKETGCDWALTNMAPNSAKLITFQVTVTGGENTVITESTAVATHQTSKITAAPAVTKILPPLGIAISSTILPAVDNKTVARPGDVVQYFVTISNYSSTAATNVIFADMVPAGMRLVNFYHQDGASLDFTNGNGDSLDNITFNTTTNPSYDNVSKVMGWKWASIPAHGQQSIRFDCQVLLDAPVFALGSKTVANNVSNTSYNAVGTFGTVKSFAAVPTAGVAAATAAANKVPVTTATLLAATLAPVKIDLTGANSLPLPKLTLKKFVSDPDGVLTVGSDLRFTVINDAAVSNDGFFHYAHAIHNGSGAGTATGVVLHEFIPTGVTFQGFLAKDGVNLASYFGCHFYNAAGVEIPYNLTAATTPLVKSFTMPIGDIAANGNVVVTYQVATTLAAGGVIVSNSAAVTGKSGLYTFDAPTGYCLTASNMNFPIVGSPKQLTVNVIAPAAFNFPAGILHSAPKVKTQTDTSEIAIPLEVIGADGLDLSDIKMVVTVPKGYLVKPTIKLVDGSGGAIAGSTNVRVASTGITTLTFPIGNNRNATATYEVYLDAANIKVLQDATGHLKAPQPIVPKLTGSYGRSASATATALAMGAPRIMTATPAPKPIAAATTTGLQEFVLGNNAAVFVGRYAPATVRRGTTLTYTIFTGNLSDTSMLGGVVTMKIPDGTTFASATPYYYNIYDHNAANDNFGNTTAPSQFKPVVSGTTVSWHIGIIAAGEGGAVSLTVNVPATYSGSRIDSNTCTFQLDNGNGKTSGPLGVVVLNGNDPSQSATTTQSAFEGVGASFSDEARTALDQKGFTINNQSYQVTTGGCDAMHLQNDAILIPLKSASHLYDRVMLVGPTATVTGGAMNIMIDNGGMRVVVGPGEPAAAATAVDVKVLLPSIPGATAFAAPNSIFSALAGGALISQDGGNLVAAGAGNLVAAGAGNLIAAGGGNLVAAGGGNFAAAGSALVLLPANAFIGSTDVGGHLVAAGAGNLIAAGAGNLIAAGGGNLVAAGAGNLVAAGAGNLIAQDGAGVIAKSAAGLIAQDGAGLQMTGKNNLFSSGTGNLVNGALVNQ